MEAAAEAERERVELLQHKVAEATAQAHRTVAARDLVHHVSAARKNAALSSALSDVADAKKLVAKMPSIVQAAVSSAMQAASREAASKESGFVRAWLAREESFRHKWRLREEEVGEQSVSSPSCRGLLASARLARTQPKAAKKQLGDDAAGDAPLFGGRHLDAENLDVENLALSAVESPVHVPWPSDFDGVHSASVEGPGSVHLQAAPTRHLQLADQAGAGPDSSALAHPIGSSCSQIPMRTEASASKQGLPAELDSCVASIARSVPRLREAFRAAVHEDAGPSVSALEPVETEIFELTALVDRAKALLEDAV